MKKTTGNDLNTKKEEEDGKKHRNNEMQPNDSGNSLGPMETELTHSRSAHLHRSPNYTPLLQ